MATGKHYGAFAKGFMDSILAVYKLSMTKDLYDARAAYYRERGDAAKENADARANKNKGLTDAENASGAAWGTGTGSYKEPAGDVAARAQQYSQELQNQGYTKAGASAILGNWWQENNLKGGGFGGDKGTSAGGFQWHDMPGSQRGTEFINWAKSNNLDVNDPETSLKYVVHDLNTNPQWKNLNNELKTTNDVDAATHSFTKTYEAPKPETANMPNRLGFARTVFGGSAAPAKPTTTTAAATTPTKGPNKGKAPPAKTADEPTKSAQAVEADTAAPEGGFRLPGDTRTPAQMDQDSPAPPPGSTPPRNERSLPPPQVAPPPPRPNEKIGAIPPGPVPAQDTPPAPTQAVRPEAPMATPLQAVRPEAPIPWSPQPIVNAARPDAPVDTRGVLPVTGARPDQPLPTRGVIAPSGARPDAPVTVTPQPIVNAARPDAPVSTTGLPPASVASEPPGTQFARPAPPAAPRMPPRTTTPATAYPPETIYGPNPRADTGARPDLTARSPETGIPSTATASVPPTNPAGNSRGFVTIDRPNADPTQRNRGSPQGTALDLSHLWGPNPPLAQQAPAPAPTPRPQDQDNSMVGSANMDDAALGVDIMGSAKGGPIRRYARGGAIPTRPMMKLAGAGPVTEPYVNQTATVPGYTYNPAYSSGANLRMEQNQALYGSATPAASADFGAAWGKLTPAQQNWYTQSAVAGDYNQANANPYPATPTSAPAPAAAAPAPAPAPVITPPTATNITAPAATTTITDPTTTTTTGAPGLPNSIQAKSYDPNVDQQTGAGFTNTSNAGGTDYSVGTDDLLKQNNQGQISGSRKGGPIGRFVKGGGIPSRPMTKFAAGGGAAASTLLSPSYSGPKPGGGWAGTAYADMAPNQQAWADQQQTLLGQEKANANNPAWSGWSQLSGTPAAIWPTAAPTAPTPLNEPAPAATTTVAPSASSTITDPTTTITTGAPGLPNSIQAKSYDPNVDQQTGAGFANTSNTGGTDYSVGTDDLLQQNSQGQISGTNQNNTTILSRRGGPIPKVTRRVTGYDDGGGVSPSAAGMPPGLGGQQAIPPIYFNPATYAGAGAPVGKGITQNSATTFNAGAIPSLPMARGGVVAFDDGGMVGDDTLNAMQSLDFADARDDQASAAPAAAPAPTTQYNSAGEPTTDVDPNEFLQPSTSTPAATSGDAGASRGSNVPPPDQTTPQIHDGQGNPSRGLIAAIGDGLHWLGDHLGLVGGAQAAPLAPNAQVQTNRQNHVNYTPDTATYMSPKDAAELDKINDPNGQLSNAYRSIARLEGGYKFALSQGDTQTAGRLAAAILHYSVITSQNLSDQASKALYNGDLQKAVDLTNQASDAVPDGRLVHMALSPDGKTVTVTGSDLDGRALWQKQGAAAEVLERATSMGKDGKLQWNALESQAAKYDSTFANMQKARTGNATAQAKEDAAEASAQRVAAAGGSGTLQPITRVGNAAPATPTPALPGPGTPASATAPAAPTAPAAGAPSSPDSTGAAAPATPPPAADSNASPYPPSPLGGAASAQPGPVGIPSRPTTEPTPSPNAPAPAAQDVSFEDITQRINNQEVQADNNDAAQIHGKYFTPQGNILYGGQEYARPPEPNVQGLTRQEQTQAIQAYNNGPLKDFNSYVAINRDAENKELAENRDIRSKQFQTLRDQARDQFSQTQQSARMREQEKLQGGREQAQADAAAKLSADHDARTAAAEKNKQILARTEPMDPKTLNARFSTQPDENGVAGKRPQDWLAASPQYGGDMNKFTTAFGKEGNVNRLSDALVNTQQFNSHMPTEQVADAVTGMANGQYPYAYDKTPVSDAWGNRYSVAFSRPDGSQGTILVPEDDMNNIIRIRQQVVKNATPATPPAATAPAIAPAPVRAPSTSAGGQAVLNPRAGSGAAPASNPVADWLHGMTNPPVRTYGPRGALPPAPQ